MSAPRFGDCNRSRPSVADYLRSLIMMSEGVKYIIPKQITSCQQALSRIGTKLGCLAPSYTSNPLTTAPAALRPEHRGDRRGREVPYGRPAPHLACPIRARKRGRCARKAQSASHSEHPQETAAKSCLGHRGATSAKCRRSRLEECAPQHRCCRI